jgi:MFS superfamily sulfate permease-like transporter
MAYVQIAGVPPQTTFYAAPIGLLAFAIFGKSLQLVVAVSAIIATMPLTSTWTINYTGLPGDQPSPITDIPADNCRFTLTGLTNYSWHTISLATDPAWLSDTITTMPTDHFNYLRVMWK